MSTQIVALLLLLPTATMLGQPSSIGISSSSTSPATSNLSSTSLNFGSSVPVGSTVSQSITISNSGGSILSIYAINPPYGSSTFYVQMNPCISVSAGKKCSFTTSFNPTTIGTFTQQMVIQTNTVKGSPTSEACTLTNSSGSQVSGYCQYVTLTGSAVNAINLLPSALTFGNVNIGSTSPSQTVKLTNNGTHSISGIKISASANFPVISTNCNNSLSPGSHCNINVGFRPTITGPINGTVTVNYTTSAGAGASVQSTLVGSGVAVLQSIAVTPANANLVAPTKQQYTATANYSDGSHTDVTTSASWSIINTAPATAAISGSGLLTTGVAGDSTVYATYNNVQGQTGVTVTNTQTGIVVNPLSPTINTGNSQQFNAYPTFSDSTTGTTAIAASWTSSNPSVAQIDMNGLAVGDASGTSTIAAKSGAYTSSASITVNGSSSCLTNNRIDMKVLLITRGKTEASFPAVTSALNYLHTPYDVFDFSTGSPLSAGQLSSGCHAFYSGVIFAFFQSDQFDPVGNTYNGLDFSTSPATVIPFNGFNNLQAFEEKFGIRQLNWYAYPALSIGFNPPAGSREGDSASLGVIGSQVFPYILSNVSAIPIDAHAYVYLATPASGTSVLSDGFYTLSLDYAFTDNSGREFLSNTFDSNQSMRHNIMLSYGLLNWVTKGMFIGEKHIFFTPQADDWGIDDDIWAKNNGSYLTIQGKAPPPVGSYPTCTNPVNTVTGMAQRISSTDAQSFVNWQTSLQSNRLFANIRLYNAFNACGLVPAGGSDSNCGSNGSPYANDTLTAWTLNVANSSHFGWINHTYEHVDLTLQDNGSPQTYENDYYQINENLLQEQALGFADFKATYMVTPDISGLDYLPALQAMVDNGVQYVVSDTSCGTEKSTTTSCFAGTNNGPGPGFNLPIVNSNNPVVGKVTTGYIYEVPRRANNLFYNAGTPDGWQSEYDCIYTNLGGTDPNGKPYGQYTVQDIKDFISGKKGIYPNFVDLMMQGDADPEMFHQTNLTAYDGTHSLLSDLLDETFNLYQSYLNLPVRSMDMDAIAQYMLNNQAFAPIDPSTGTPSWNVSGTVNNGSSRTLTLSVTHTAIIPVTGLQNSGSETYGSQVISHVQMAAGSTLTQAAP